MGNSDMKNLCSLCYSLRVKCMYIVSLLTLFKTSAFSYVRKKKIQVLG